MAYNYSRRSPGSQASIRSCLHRPPFLRLELQNSICSSYRMASWRPFERHLPQMSEECCRCRTYNRTETRPKTAATKLSSPRQTQLSCCRARRDVAKPFVEFSCAPQRKRVMV